MSESLQNHSKAWQMFTVISFVVACVMMAIGIIYLPGDLAMKGFYGMSAIMLVQTSITMTKTLRDNQEAERLNRKIADAKTEKLLREVS